LVLCAWDGEAADSHSVEASEDVPEVEPTGPPPLCCESSPFVDENRQNGDQQTGDYCCVVGGPLQISRYVIRGPPDYDDAEDPELEMMRTGYPDDVLLQPQHWVHLRPPLLQTQGRCTRAAPDDDGAGGPPRPRISHGFIHALFITDSPLGVFPFKI